MLSRFQMHDLIKITQKKEDFKIITFYFRIPIFHNYIIEKKQEIMQSLNQMPPNGYQLAYKRLTGQEVTISFKFESEMQAKQCIEIVSGFY